MYVQQQLHFRKMRRESSWIWMTFKNQLSSDAEIRTISELTTPISNEAWHIHAALQQRTDSCTTLFFLSPQFIWQVVKKEDQEGREEEAWQE
jgi:hypothetical protein